MDVKATECVYKLTSQQKMKTKNTFLLLFLGIWFFLVAKVVPDLRQGEHDAYLYELAGRCFHEHGLGCAHDREPFFPIVLSLLLHSGLELSQALPVFQNVFFLFSVFVLLSVALPAWHWSRRLGSALAVALVPTFLIPMNGAAYTESVSASLVCLFVACSVAFVSGRRVTAFLFTGGLVLAAFALNLTKGSFSFVHCLVAIFFVLGAFLWREKKLRFLALAVIVGFSSLATTPLRAWIFGQNGMYSRGGAVLFGRTEYAERFDFSRNSWPYFLNGLSEGACARIYGALCKEYAFGAENYLGNSRFAEGVSDEQLFRDGIKNILEHPLRQLIFIPFEWTKLILHHGTTGFARLEAGLVGAIVHSFPLTLALKILNLLLYVVFFYALVRNLRLWLKKPDLASLPTYAIFIYLGSYLGVYGFVTTVIRMAYPVAPLFLLFVIITFSASAMTNRIRWLRAGPSRPTLKNE